MTQSTTGRQPRAEEADASAPGPASEAGEAPAIDVSKLLIELGPLVVFLGVTSWRDIFYGTSAFMVATFTALAASRIIYGRIPVMPLVSGLLVLVFGGLTLYLKNEMFIMIKPTILYTIFGAILLGGLVRGVSLLRYLFGEAYNLTDLGWRLLTLRWALFFFFLAVLNEIVWRNTSQDFWLKFKVFGFIPLTIVFALAQTGLVSRHTPAKCTERRANEPT